MIPGERHGQVEAAREILEQTFGAIDHTEIFQTWGPTVVMGATLASGRKVVIKASALQDVRVEAHTSSMASSLGFPVPTMLGQGDDARLPGRHWFAMEHLRGVWWHNAGWSRAQHLNMLAELARHLVALHSTRIDGYGPLDVNGSGKFRSWSDWLRSGFERSAAILEASGAIPVPSPKRSSMLFLICLQSLVVAPARSCTRIWATWRSTSIRQAARSPAL